MQKHVIDSIHKKNSISEGSRYMRGVRARYVMDGVG